METSQREEEEKKDCTSTELADMPTAIPNE